MKYIELKFRDKKREIGYLLSNTGITISYVQGYKGTTEDLLTAKERDQLIIAILKIK